MSLDHSFFEQMLHVVQATLRRRIQSSCSTHARRLAVRPLARLPSRYFHGNRPICLAESSVELLYQKKTPLEHVLLRPGMYIGSVESTKESMWIWSDSEHCMVQRSLEYVPALYKIFDEILVNAVDNKVRDDKMSRLEVQVEAKTKPWISVFNDGKGIPIQFHKHENVYVPELVLGHLLTGSNFNDATARLTGGRHGYGAKLTNIFSTEFIVETGDAKAGLRYSQTWKNNMRERGEPIITEYNGPDFTKISFSPDLPKFELTKLNQSMIRVLRKRVFDVAGCLPNVDVRWNGESIPIVGFESYVHAFEGSTTKEKIPSLYTKANKRWEVGIAPSDVGFVQVSFVNGMTTSRGGSHVNYILEQIVKRIADHINAKHKDMTVTATQVKPHVALFVNALIENPTFDSQMKEYLTSRPNTYGSTCLLSERYLKSVIANSGIVERVVAAMKTKQRTALNKKVTKKAVQVPKLEDANLAGSARSADCTLILTEGDSAKALAVAGLSVVGRDTYGVFPLRGKFLNVRDASDSQLAKNAEFGHLCTILGLKLGTSYTTDEEIATLRYGRVMIMTDQDHDGSHIKGLLLNLFHTFWPNLIKDGFISAFLTPLLKVHTSKKKILPFFSVPEYQKWVQENPEINHRVKYYKGLGTSTSAEGKAYFEDLAGHTVDFKWTEDSDGDAIAMVFSKDRVAERKTWLTNMDTTKFVSERQPTIRLEEFVNAELIQFSHADNARSIPSAIDGLKPSQRKVLFACLRRKLTKEIKVAQLAGYCAEHTAYHHGEASLHSTIINMAQDYVGANNIPLLYPSGQFGTRLQGGKDAASPRYIFTYLHKYTRLIFPEEDEPLLEYMYDDGEPVEPTYYVPILPMLLVNGTEGIGTGWSTSIPSHHPIELIDRLVEKLDNMEISQTMLQPWVKGFNGSIEPNGDNFVTSGEVEILKITPKSVSVRITELPVGKWVEDYKNFLQGLVATKKLRSFSEHHTDKTVCFDLVVEKESNDKDLIPQFRKLLKLESNLNTSNMHAFDADGKLRKFESSSDIFDEYFSVRLVLYTKRKLYNEARLERECIKLTNRVQFLQSMTADTSPLRSLWLSRPSKLEMIDTLRSAGFAPAHAFQDPPSSSDDDDTAYDYLLKTSFLHFTQENIDKLHQEHQAKQSALEDLRTLAPIQMWKQELLSLRQTLIEDPEYRQRLLAMRSFLRSMQESRCFMYPAEYSEHICACLRPSTLLNVDNKVVYALELRLGKVHWLVHKRYSEFHAMRYILIKQLSKRAVCCRICKALLKGLQSIGFPPKKPFFTANIDMNRRHGMLAGFAKTVVSLLQVLRQHSLLCAGCDVTPLLRMVEEFVGLDFNRYTRFLAERGVLVEKDTMIKKL
ncbi:DNA topoisomerase 2 DNA gyrase B [Thraustotheca clavata]|uniref:DNA topoisomerase 2 n=1 Tax=Thraustotheca clavata TaxID=74557 RepID=A0A1V9ZPS0_9STRA|nr:DNA topoisomerase 2 DNA gyrase B [Thraustotheca clavata]